MIREARDSDMAAIGRIFHAAVMEGTAAHYTHGQRAAWAGPPRDAAYWANRLAGQTVLVAERDGEVAGFFSLTEDGCQDTAFVDPAHAGAGVGSALLSALEAKALDQGHTLLTTFASLAARPFFLARGWTVVRPNTATIRGESLDNFLMQRDLGPQTNT